MAVVLDAFASHVARLLTDTAKEEVGMLLGVSREISRTGVKLGDLRDILADADRRNFTDRVVQGWVRELKDAMYDATDILDLYQLRTLDSTSMAGCCNPLLFCLQNPLVAHHIGSRIRALNRRLDGIRDRSAQFGFVNLISSNDDRNSKKVISRSAAANRETTGEPVRSDVVVVGDKIREDTRELVAMLTEKRDNGSDIMVAAIVGVGGIGKTTLAREIFNHETIREKFDKRIWLSVNQDFDKAELLRTTITLAGGDHHGEKAMAVLQRALAAALTGKKLLLVMDDVWSHRAWEDVLQIPLINATHREGSRVIITTRDERVARAMKALQPYHHVDKLGAVEAWSLLKKQVCEAFSALSYFSPLSSLSRRRQNDKLTSLFASSVGDDYGDAQCCRIVASLLVTQISFLLCTVL